MVAAAVDGVALGAVALRDAVAAWADKKGKLMLPNGPCSKPFIQAVISGLNIWLLEG